MERYLGDIPCGSPETCNKGLGSDDAGATIDAPHPVICQCTCKRPARLARGPAKNWLHAGEPRRPRLACSAQNLRRPGFRSPRPQDRQQSFANHQSTIAGVLRSTPVTMVTRMKKLLNDEWRTCPLGPLALTSKAPLSSFLLPCRKPLGSKRPRFLGKKKKKRKKHMGGGESHGSRAMMFARMLLHCRNFAVNA